MRIETVYKIQSNGDQTRRRSRREVSVGGMLTDAECRELLGVAAGCPKTQIRRAYLRLAKNVHPDKNKSPDATAHFQRISAAYQQLCSENIDNDSSQAGGGAQQHCLDDVCAACEVFNEAVRSLAASLDIAFHPDHWACAPDRVSSPEPISSPERVASPDFHSDNEFSYSGGLPASPSHPHFHHHYAQHTSHSHLLPPRPSTPWSLFDHQQDFFRELGELCDQEERRLSSGSRSPSPLLDSVFERGTPSAWPQFSSCTRALRKRQCMANLDIPPSEEGFVKHVELDNPLHASLRLFCAPATRLTSFYRGCYPLVLKCMG